MFTAKNTVQGRGALVYLTKQVFRLRLRVLYIFSFETPLSLPPFNQLAATFPNGVLAITLSTSKRTCQWINYQLIGENQGNRDRRKRRRAGYNN